MKEKLSNYPHQAIRNARARDWELTAYVAWAGAIAAALWAGVANGPHTGDLVFSGYLALLGVALWAQAVRIRHSSRAPAFTHTLATVLTIALAIAFLLGIADLASGGHF
jgi:hypothetical protein